jgi:5-methylcytosine-specific restriction endonuclease McrA
VNVPHEVARGQLLLWYSTCVRVVRLCKTKGCGRKHEAKGLCNSCYCKAWKKRNKEHVRSSRRAWLAANKDHTRTYARERARANPEQNRARVLAWQRENKEKVNAKSRAWQRSHREQVKAAGLRYRLANPEKEKARAKAWLAANPDIARARTHRRRALLKTTPGSFTPQEWADRLAEYGGVCPCCKQEAELTVDHIVPVSKGGTNWIWNLQPLCLGCNVAKSNRHSTYYPAPVHSY